MASDEPYAEFWSWWVERERQLSIDVTPAPSPDRLVSRLLRTFVKDPSRGPEIAVGEVDRRLAEIHPRLTCGYAVTPEQIGWWFTGNGDAAAFDEAAALVGVCPRPLADRFTAGAPRRAAATVTVAGRPIARREARFVFGLHNRGHVVGIVLDAARIADWSDAELEQAAWLLAVNELGERLLLRLGGWRVMRADAESARSARPLDELLNRARELLDGTGTPIPRAPR